MSKVWHNGEIREATAEEQKEIDDRKAKALAEKPAKKLSMIRYMRNKKLSETDYLAMSDNTMSEEMKTYRQNLRNIPQDYSEDKYDELLARDEEYQLTHTVWSKP